MTTFLLVWSVLSVATAWLFTGAIERDRQLRFPTVSDRMPRATATWRQRRAWRKEQLVVETPNRRRV